MYDAIAAQPISNNMSMTEVSSTEEEMNRATPKAEAAPIKKALVDTKPIPKCVLKPKTQTPKNYKPAQQFN